MRLLEAIIDANHRAAAGDPKAGLHPAEYDDSLPLVALTCIDVRLNPLLPEVLGIPEEQFIWLRNAGNIITGPLSSTMRSLALACAVKGGREIAVIGHTDCLVCKTTMMKLTDAFRALGIDRAKLPENLTDYFGLFASERQNVIKGAEIVRGSPIIGPKIPVHGLLVDIETGRLEWLVNGYTMLGTAPLSYGEALKETAAESVKEAVAGGMNLLGAKLAEFKSGEMKFPEFKIGEVAFDPNKWLSQAHTHIVENPETARPPEPSKRKPPPMPVKPPFIQRAPKLHQPWKLKK